jgi:hypothetical protein
MIPLVLLLTTAAVASGMVLSPRFTPPPTSKSKYFTLVANSTATSDLDKPLFASLATRPYVSMFHLGVTDPETIFPVLDRYGAAVFWQRDSLPANANAATIPNLTPQDHLVVVSIDGSSTLELRNESEHIKGIFFGHFTYEDIESGPVSPKITTRELDEQAPNFYVSVPPYQLRELAFPMEEYSTARMFACALWNEDPVFELKVVGGSWAKGDVPSALAPDNCTPISLAVQCATAPEGKVAGEGAVEVECYDDVASIDWSKVYGE